MNATKRHLALFGKVQLHEWVDFAPYTFTARPGQWICAHCGTATPMHGKRKDVTFHTDTCVVGMARRVLTKQAKIADLRALQRRDGDA